MRGRVLVVTDSTAYLPSRLQDTEGLRVAPVQVVIGGRSYDEGVDVDAGHVVEALRAWQPVSTSRPSPEVMAQLYQEAAASQATGVVSVHLSGSMSGTVESAEIAARTASLPVRVVDSRLIGMALGFAVLAGVEVAQAGASVDEVAAAIEKRCADASTYFYVDTLEYLRRGGRIGAASALLGAALSVKPLLELRDGQIQPLERLRTTSRAIARLEELALQAAGTRSVDVAVHHLESADRARQLADRLRARLPQPRQVLVQEVGAVVGTHVGPGMLAVAISPI